MSRFQSRVTGMNTLQGQSTTPWTKDLLQYLPGRIGRFPMRMFILFSSDDEPEAMRVFVCFPIQEALPRTGNSWRSPGGWIANFKDSSLSIIGWELIICGNLHWNLRPLVRHGLVCGSVGQTPGHRVRGIQDGWNRRDILGI